MCVIDIGNKLVITCHPNAPIMLEDLHHVDA